jgi:hypothetical protein
LPVYPTFRHPFGVHSASIRRPFGVHSASIRRPFGVHSASIRRPFGVHSAFIRHLAAKQSFTRPLRTDCTAMTTRPRLHGRDGPTARLPPRPFRIRPPPPPPPPAQPAAPVSFQSPVAFRVSGLLSGPSLQVADRMLKERMGECVCGGGRWADGWMGRQRQSARLRLKLRLRLRLRFKRWGSHSHLLNSQTVWPHHKCAASARVTQRKVGFEPSAIHLPALRHSP